MTDNDKYLHENRTNLIWVANSPISAQYLTKVSTEVDSAKELLHRYAGRINQIKTKEVKDTYMSQVFVLHPSQNISGYFLPYKYSNLTFSKQRLEFSILKEV